MSAPTPVPATPSSAADAPLTAEEERELLQALVLRDKAEGKRALEASRALAANAACPVCRSSLDAARSWLPDWACARPRVACAKCGLDAPAVPSLPVDVASMVAVAALAWRALGSILEAQQLTQNGPRSWAFVQGGVLAVIAMQLYTIVRGRRSGQTAAELIASRWRERDDATNGLPRRPKWVLPFRQQSDLLREVVFCAVLFLLLRHVAVEAYVIPTGSMAPTLLGNNFRTACERCGVDFPVGKGETERLDGSAIGVTCPLCQEEFAAHPTKTTDGNKILVDKLIYRLRPPRRWEVVVFHNPTQPHLVFIKRLVGLPGDELAIRHGDIYVDGRLERKPDDVQDAIWIPVLDTRLRYAGGAERFEPTGQPGAWRLEEDGARITATPVGGAGNAWLDTRDTIVNWNAYNRHEDRQYSAVGDLRITAEVTGAEGATARLATMEHGRAVVAHLPIGTGEGEYRLTVEEGGRETVLAVGKGPALPPGAPTTVSLAYADDQARLIIDGETRLRALDPEGAVPAGDSHVRLGAAGGQVTFTNARVDRDVHYTPVRYSNAGTGLEEPLKVPDNAYMCMGDNTLSSSDSRYWGFVREEMMLGRAFFVWWPVVPMQLGRVR